ncbi:MAG: RNA polymerase-binding protein DksA [Alphaproteobacteria bacterium]|nr:RNA polymerase-binding protein DksA [Alphaproteobacteria bacterium]
MASKTKKKRTATSKPKAKAGRRAKTGVRAAAKSKPTRSLKTRKLKQRPVALPTPPAKPARPRVAEPPKREPTALEKRLLQLERSGKAKASGQNLRQRMYQRARVPRNYVPSETETFMSPRQSAYFKNRLLDWREELLKESSQTIINLQEGGLAEPDLADRASAESDRSLELRTRDRERKLISKIDAALERIENGIYGFCEETGEPIGLKRLIARPIATLSIEAQERHERREKVYRDD